MFKKEFSFNLVIPIFFLGVLFLSIGCGYINKKLNIPNDNIGEELVEEVIKHETGMDIDLTPSTPENRRVAIPAL